MGWSLVINTLGNLQTACLQSLQSGRQTLKTRDHEAMTMFIAKGEMEQTRRTSQAATTIITISIMKLKRKRRIKETRIVILLMTITQVNQKQIKQYMTNN